jgi:hypothetical protein
VSRYEVLLLLEKMLNQMVTEKRTPSDWEFKLAVLLALQQILKEKES